MNIVLLIVKGWIQARGRRDTRLARELRQPSHPRPPRLALALYVSFAVLGLFALFPGIADAKILALFDPMTDDVKSLSHTWFGTLHGLVKNVFTLVATIELCWSAAVWAFERDNLNSFTVELLKKVMTIGFFFTLLTTADQWVPAITDSFEQAGDKVVGQTLSTDQIIEDGLGKIEDLWGGVLGGVYLLTLVPEEFAGTAIPIAYTNLDIAEAQLLVTGIISIVVALAYFLTAAQYFLLKVEAYVLFAAGAMYLGFGGASWGKDYVMKYLNYSVNAGVRLLVLILSLTLTQSAIGKAPFAFDIGAELKFLGLVLLQAVLAVKAPDMAGGLMGYPGAGLTASGVFSSALNTLSQIQMLSMGTRIFGGGGHGAGGAHDVGRAANLGNATGTGPSGPGPRDAASDAQVRGLGGDGPGNGNRDRRV